VLIITNFIYIPIQAIIHGFFLFHSYTCILQTEIHALHFNCRSLIHPHDIVKFDELISPHEMSALRKKAPESDSSDTVSIEYEYSDRDIDNGSEDNNFQEEEEESGQDSAGARMGNSVGARMGNSVGARMGNSKMEAHTNGKFCDCAPITNYSFVKCFRNKRHNQRQPREVDFFRYDLRPQFLPIERWPKSKVLVLNCPPPLFKFMVTCLLQCA